MAEIVLKKGTVISHTELETNEVVIFADEITGSMKKMNHLGEVVTFAEGLTLEQIEDMLGNSFEDSATVAFVYTDALSSPFSAFVKQDGLDHTQIQNIGTNTHAQIDTFISNINETITDKINDTVLTTSPLNKVFNDTANTVTLSLNDSGVVAGTYGSSSEIAQPTVNVKGQVTQVATVPISITSTAITDITEKVQDTVASMWISGNGIQTSYNDTAGFLTVSVNQANLDHTQIQNKGTNTHAQIDTHLANTSNPHGVTIAQIGAEASGTATGLMAGHVNAVDPHIQYLKETDAANTYAVLNHTHQEYDDFVAQSDERRNDIGEPTGFVDIAESVLSFTNATRTFSISPTVTSFSYYQTGEKFTLTGESIQIPNTEGIHYIYFDQNTLYSTQIWSDDLYNLYTYVAVLYWSVAAQQHIFMGDHRHGCVMSWATHKYINDNNGILIQSGGVLTSIVPDGNGTSNTHIQFGVSESKLVNADITYSYLSRPSTATISKYLRIGLDADKKWSEIGGDSFPVLTGANGRAICNKLISGSWTQTQLASGHYVMAHVLAFTDTNRKYCVLIGQNSYATINEARDNILNEVASLSVEGIPVREFKFLGTLLIQTSDSYTNSMKSVIVSTASGEPYTDLRFANFVTSAGTPVGDHANLTNIQGGAYGEYYHFSLSQHTNTLAHLTNVSNPHSVTKAQIGLSNVPNVDATARANHTGTQAASTITGLSTVATSGSYNDLTNKPSILDTEGVQDLVSTMISATSPIVETYDDTAGTLTLSHASSGVVVGTYGTASSVPSITVNAQGHATGISTVPILIGSSQISDLSEAIDDRMTAAVIATAPITETYNDVANTLTLSLANSGVTAGTYGSATQSNAITVDALGRVTSASNVAISIPSTQISDITEKIQDTVATMLVPQFPMLTFYDDVGDGSLQIGLNISSISHADIADIGTNTHAQIDTHLASTANPHATTKAQVGLGNCDNTSDLAKPISTATQTALNGKQATIANGTLGQFLTYNKTWKKVSLYELEEYPSGVTPSPSDYLYYNGTQWVPSPMPTPALTYLSDVLVTSIQNKQVLQWNSTSSKWTNVAPDSTYISDFAEAVDDRVNALVTTTSHISKTYTDSINQMVLDLSLTGVTAATYGDNTTIPIIAVDSRGRITSASNGIIPNASTSQAGLMSAADKVKLDNSGQYVTSKTATTYSNTSNTSAVLITELSIPVIAGQTITGKFLLKTRTAATTTGISLAFQTFSGVLAASVEIPLTATTNYYGNLNSANVYITATGHPAASATYLAYIDFVFTATANTTLTPMFRSEINGSGVFVDPNSICLVMEV